VVVPAGAGGEDPLLPLLGVRGDHDDDRLDRDRGVDVGVDDVEMEDPALDPRLPDLSLEMELLAAPSDCYFDFGAMAPEAAAEAFGPDDWGRGREEDPDDGEHQDPDRRVRAHTSSVVSLDETAPTAGDPRQVRRKIQPSAPPPVRSILQAHRGPSPPRFSLLFSNKQDDPAPASPQSHPWLFEPTPGELAEARTPRGRRGLDSWYRHARLLAEYRDSRGGSCDVPQSVRPLGTWCNKQRQAHKLLSRPAGGEGGGEGGGGPGEGKGPAARMTPRRMQVLEAIGFKWASPKGAANWAMHYGELEAILRERGSVRGVPVRPDKKGGFGGGGGGEGGIPGFAGLPFKRAQALGRWITEQRRQKGMWDEGGPEASSLTAERIEMLDRLGFEWGRPRRGRDGRSPAIGGAAAAEPAGAPAEAV
jgi:hypothetical protein